MKNLFFFLVLYFCSSIITFSQVASNFEIFPRHNQVFQRNSDNKAQVLLKGSILDETQTEISVIVTRDEKPYFYKKQKLVFQNKIANFNQQFDINAELILYDIYFYSIKGKDSTLLKGAFDVVAGETLILYGQSNIYADFDIKNLEIIHPFIRTFFINFDNNDTNWFSADKWNNWMTGTIGLELAKLIILNYKIPVGIINGAEGGHSIAELTTRDNTNPENKFTDYGRLLRRVNQADLYKTAKIMIWRQGEREAFDSTMTVGYEATFDKLYKQIFTDFTGIQKLYNVQNNLLTPKNSRAGNLRDFQRRSKYLYPKIETLSSIGTDTYDGVHYFNKGYLQTANELFRLIQRDIFKGIDTTEINSPDIKSAFLTPKQDTLVFEFENSQKISTISKVTNTENSKLVVNKLTDFVYLDGLAIKSDSAHVQKNFVFFPLKEKSNAKNVTFMPDNWSNIDLTTKFPLIKNSRGMRAFTFKNVPLSVKAFKNDNPTIIVLNTENPNPDLMIFPNPVSEFLMIKNESRIKKVEIFNQMGQNVFEKNYDESEIRLPIHDFAVGVHVINILDKNNKKKIRKFVIQ